jgi:cupin 2 domain-containing protein
LPDPACALERIVSFGQASPPGFWYDQPQVEWVLLLKGAALHRFADAEATAQHLRVIL